MKKIDLIAGAYERLRISGLTVSPSPALNAKALDRMESMLAEYERDNCCIGYNFQEQPDFNDDANVQLADKEMVCSNLAVRLIPDFNKMVPPRLETIAQASYGRSLGASFVEGMREVNPSSRMPLGSGVSYRWFRFRDYNTGDTRADNNCFILRLKVGEAQDYSETFSEYILDGVGTVVKQGVAQAGSGPDLLIGSGFSTINGIVYNLVLNRDTGVYAPLLTIVGDTQIPFLAGSITFNVGDFYEIFDNYPPPEFIDSYTVTADTGITVSNVYRDTTDSPEVIQYRLTADTAGEYEVTITVNTTLGRTEIRTVHVEVYD